MIANSTHSSGLITFIIPLLAQRLYSTILAILQHHFGIFTAPLQHHFGIFTAPSKLPKPISYTQEENFIRGFKPFLESFAFFGQVLSISAFVNIGILWAEE